jgi:ribonucleoside-triphosphate reductase
MFLTKIKKIDGAMVDFDSERIKDALHKVFLAVELEDGPKAESVSNEVVQILERKFQQSTPSVEDVEDVIVEVLQKQGYDKDAIKYQDFR